MNILNMIKFLFLLFFLACPQLKEVDTNQPETVSIIPGAEQLELYINDLKDKNVAIVANQASLINGVHLLDVLLENDISVKQIMPPEHGFRGKADAGEKVDSSIDEKTGIEIVSIYGKNRKPTPENLESVDILVFDLQDVGVRFYTYISTLHYVMEACAEQNIPVMILDRPNPNAHYIDGPILDPSLKSFVGMHEVPIVYGMTIGEYGMMINGEGWLDDNVVADLKVIPCANYTHKSYYELPVKPSPNLPNARSVGLYPSLCLFEGTNVSVGRGTEHQFQVIGSPILESHKSYSFTPISREGAKYPKHQNEICYGEHFLDKNPKALHKEQQNLNLSTLLEYASIFKEKNESFFLENKFFNKLAGNTVLMQQILDGETESSIRASWGRDIAAFKKIRAKYLLYKE